MAITLKQVEETPNEHPNIAPYEHIEVFEEDADLDPAIIWERIERYIAYRWTPRLVVWTVEGGGDWEPPLAPTTITKTEIWYNAAWQSVELSPSPMGGLSMPCSGPYRITATVGDGNMPQVVEEAYRRLYEYSRGIAGNNGNEAAYRKSNDNEVISSWAGKALQLSGAADLLRPYRRV